MYLTQAKNSFFMSSSTTCYKLLNWMIASVWLINGLYCKVFGMVPRHREIVERILGEKFAHEFTFLIGLGEVCIAFAVILKPSKWLTGFQIIMVITMNILELIMAHDLLLWGKYNLFFASIFALILFFNEYHLRPMSKGSEL